MINRATMKQRPIEWWQLRDLSYIQVKTMKSKSMSEGLVRCKVRQNRAANSIY